MGTHIDPYAFSNMKGEQNNRIEDLLLDGEEILWRGKPNKRVLKLESIFSALPIVIIWVAFDAFIISVIISTMLNEVFSSGLLFFIIPFFILHLAPVWFWIGNIIKATKGYKNIDYAITNKRIIIRSGIIGINYQIFMFQEISSVNCKVGIFDKMFNVGDIYLKSSTLTGAMLDIENPYQMYNRIQKIITDIKSDLAYPNAYRPEENEGYKTKYKG